MSDAAGFVLERLARNINDQQGGVRAAPHKVLLLESDVRKIIQEYARQHAEIERLTAERDEARRIAETLLGDFAAFRRRPIELPWEQTTEWGGD